MSVPSCRRGFTEVATLKIHSIISTGEHEFICGIYEKDFTKESLLKHLVVLTKEKSYMNVDLLEKLCSCVHLEDTYHYSYWRETIQVLYML